MGDVTQLGMFEGLRPDVTEIKLSGSTPGGGTHRIGDYVFLVIKAQVVGVNHERRGKDPVLVRAHKIETLESMVLPQSVGRDLLNGVLPSEAAEG